MRMKRNVICFALAMLMVMSLLGGCAQSGTTTQEPKTDVPSAPDVADKGTEDTPEVSEPSDGSGDKYGGTVVIGYANEPDTLNVYSTHLLGDVQACMVEGLLVPDGDMHYQPVLAKEVPTLDNGLIEMTDDDKMTITYHLKEDVKWHDGQPFTSADVKYTWEALSDESFLAESKEGVADIERIETPDDYTVVCYYKYRVPDFADQLFTFGILPKHMCEGTDLNEQTGYNRAPIGTGPFKFKEWKSGEYIELVKNEDYHVEGQPYLDGIVFKMITDQNTQIAQLKTGEIDYVQGLPYDKYEEIAGINGVKVMTKQLNSWRYLDFNTEKPGLDDPKVRQAFAHAIDKEAIVNQLFGGIPVAWDSPWQPMDDYYNPDLPKYEYDPDKAAALLDEAGWKVGADGIREKDGFKMQYDYGVTAGRTVDEKMQQVIIAAMKPLGVELTANNAAGSTMTAKWNEGDFDVKMSGWITAPSPSRSKFYSTTAFPPNGINHVRWVNEEFTDLMAQADKELDTAKRKDLVFKCQEIFNAELPELVILNTTDIVGMNENLEGVVLNPTNMTHFWHTSEWYLSK